MSLTKDSSGTPTLSIRARADTRRKEYEIMRIPSSQGSSTVLTAFFSSSGSAASTTSNQNALDGALSQLAAAINGGDMAQAKRYLAVVKQLSTSKANADSRLSQSVSVLSTDLSQNNVAGAQSTIQQLVRYTRAYGVEGNSVGVTADARIGSPVNAIGQNVMDLSSAINSGNFDQAQSAYDALSSSLSQDGTSSSASSANRANPTGESVGSLLAQIGSALSAGDITSARSALDRFLQGLSAGRLVTVQA